MSRLILILTLLTTLLVGCGSAGTDGVEVHSLPGDPLTRSVRLETEGCGYASGHVGSGVAIGGGMVITVAHLVVRAESIAATVGDQSFEDVPVSAIDVQRDLAVIRLPADGESSLDTSSVTKGARGLVVGGSGSGTVPFEVKGVVELTIEDVLGAERHSRRGYELEAVTRDGDSGAGAYDEQGRLIGIVFATGQDGSTTWVTASSEIEDFLSTIEPGDTYDLCQ